MEAIVLTKNHSKAVIERVRTGITSAALAALCLGLAAHPAHAGAVLSNGHVRLGVMDTGNLGESGVGLYLNGVGDAIIPGIVGEGWGISANGTDAGGANRDIHGVFNLDDVHFSATPTTATSSVTLHSLPYLQIIQGFAPATGAPNILFEDHVTVKNNSNTETLLDLRYRRVMDWDVPPIPGNEFITIGGIGGVGTSGLLYSSDNGFADPNPLVDASFLDPGTVNTNVVDNGPSEGGSVFDFALGTLAPQTWTTFNLYYGAAYNEADALTALTQVGAPLYSLGQSSDLDVNGNPSQISGAPGTYIFGAIPAPEPSSLALLGAGLAGLVTRRRRKQR
jgi:hypothetical protein